MFPFLRILILSLLLLTACGQAASCPTQTNNPFTSSTASPTNSIALVFSPTSQGTRIPSTPTVISTLQKTSFTSTYTPTPYPTDLPMPTPTAAPPGLALLSDPFLAKSSPDGMWFWENKPGDSMSGKLIEITHFVHVDGKREWRVQPKIEEIRNWHKAYYEPFFWSPKEPYVFLVGQVCCGDGPGTAYIYTSLVRLNLSTGLLSIQVPWGSYHSFSFSPTGRYMNCATVGEHSLHITRLLDGHEIEIKLPERYHDFGAGYWSPDGKRFVVYICETNNPIEEFCQKRPILLFEPETEAYQVIIADSLGQNWDTKWIDATHFQLKNLSDSVGTKIFDVETGNFVP